MSKKKKHSAGRAVRDAPLDRVHQRSEGSPLGAAFLSVDGWDILCSNGWQPVWKCPEVQMCISVFADLIGCMTLRLMRNTGQGDERVKNGLSRKLDIDPSRFMTRITFMQTVVRILMTHGNCVVFPFYKDGLLDDLRIIPPGEVSFVDDGRGAYVILWRGRELDPDEVLHFVLNPDINQPWHGLGYTIGLRDAVDGLRQGEATKNALMKSPAPSIIVKVDGLVEEFASAEGRRRLRAQYLDSSEAGEPWFIPAEQFSVEQVKPLSLTDLAIRDNLELDKRTVAGIFGIPPYMVGVGAYNKDEYRNFINTRVLAVAKIIEQELTKKLLYSEDMYFRFSNMSLYSYDLGELVSAGTQLIDHMAIRRNELRDWLSLSPDPDMHELLALEYYIPQDRLGDQKKLNPSEKEDGTAGETGTVSEDNDGGVEENERSAPARNAKM